MRVVSALCLFSLGALSLPACGEEAPASLGLDDPIRVEGAQFFTEPLPGDSEPVSEGPEITNIDLPSRILVHRATELRLSGLVSQDAVAVGIGFPSIEGSGHWVIPTGGVEPTDPTERIFVAAANIGSSAPPGLHPLRVVAIDTEGRVSRQRRLEVCIQPDIPDNGNGCSSSRPLPEVVAVLQWDADSDVDLVVVTPDGRTVTPRNPLTEDLPTGDDGETLPPSDPAYELIPRISRDSLMNCMPDGMRQESLMFVDRPSGEWSFRARLFDSCGVPTIRYNFTVYEPEGTGDERRLVERRVQAGRFIATYDTDTSDLGHPIFSVDFD